MRGIFDGKFILSALFAVSACFGPVAASVPDSIPPVTPDGFITPGPAFGKVQRPHRPSVGLVLSGGGAKGIAHIGVIQALEDGGIPIDYITGTSMGAIVGALYASGYSPAEMIDLIASKGFGYWSTGRIDPDYTYYYSTHRDTPSFVTLNLGKDSTQITTVLPVSLINPIPMNYAFFELFSSYTLRCGGDFNRLFVPYRCVTSDVYAKHKVVLGRGPLGDAVRMSMSFPMVFEPITLRGVPMYDGGIYDNYPVDVMMEEFNPDAVIGVNVGSARSAPDTRNMLDQLELMIMQPDNYPFPDDRGVNIRIDLDEFGLLAFNRYKEIYDIGYRRGVEMMDSIKRRISPRVEPAAVRAARDEFKRSVPEVRISKVTVRGGTKSEDAFLASFFNRHTPTVSVLQTRDAYYRAISTGRLQNFIPTPRFNVRDSLVDIDFQAIVRDPFTLGVGGYVSSSTSSMLFFNAGYNTLNFKSIRANVNAWLGQSYMAAEGDFSFTFNSRNPSALVLRMVTSRQKYHQTEKLFYQIREPDFIVSSESFVRAVFRCAPSLRTEFNAGAGYGHLTDRFHPDMFSSSLSSRREKSIFNLGEVFTSLELNTLDDEMNPTAGRRLRGEILGAFGNHSLRPADPDARRTRKSVSWAKIHLEGSKFFELGRHIALGADGQILYSTRKLLSTFDASLVAAEAFHPTPSSYNFFNSRLRANSFVTAGLEPVWKISGSLQMRGSFHCFLPMRKIVYRDGPAYGKWFHDPAFFGELRAVLALPFGSVSAYGNYTPSHDSTWNFGISIGTFILAPRFLR